MKKILIATDLTADSETALERGCALAADRCIAVHLLHVAPRATPPDEVSILRAQMEAKAFDLAERHACITDIAAQVTAGSPPRSIAAVADAVGAGLIVVGRERAPRWNDSLFGSSTERLLRRTSLPVLVARNPASQRYRKALVAVDTGTAAQAALDLAFSLPSIETVCAVHAFSMGTLESLRGTASAEARRRGEQVRLEHALAQARGRHRGRAVVTSASAIEGDPISVIEQAWDDEDPDILVLVTHARLSVALGLRDSFAELAIEGERFDLLIQRLS